MKSRTVTATMVALSLFFVGAGISQVRQGGLSARHTNTTQHAPAPTSAPVRLPTIVVTPSAAEIAAALASEDTTDTQTTASQASGPFFADEEIIAPRVRLDMPYYSFAKTIRRANKE
jgi:hypothetical protein